MIRRVARAMKKPDLMRSGGNSFEMAGPTGIEPATSGLTGRCANQSAPRPHLNSDIPECSRALPPCQ